MLKGSTGGGAGGITCAIRRQAIARKSARRLPRREQGSTAPVGANRARATYKSGRRLSTPPNLKNKSSVVASRLGRKSPKTKFGRDSSLGSKSGQTPVQLPVPDRAAENDQRQRNGRPLGVVQERCWQRHHHREHHLRAHEDRLRFDRPRVERLVLLEKPALPHQEEDDLVHGVLWARGEPSEAGLDIGIGVELGLRHRNKTGGQGKQKKKTPLEKRVGGKT